MARPFSKSAQHRLLLISENERIQQSQIHPFRHFAKNLYRAYGASVREVSLKSMLQGKASQHTSATIVALQTPFNISDSDLNRLFDQVNILNPEARRVFLDWTAPTDLRNAARVAHWADVYLKKHLLRDRTAYNHPTQGDTNLTDHYARRFGLHEPERHHPIPPFFFDKLVVGPSFATSPSILPEFLRPLEWQTNRPIDIHARLGIEGTTWYKAMRSEAQAALTPLSDLSIAQGNNVPMHQFMSELRHSKLCFSPFGYGEVCWRDYEAVAHGAVLLKPDMSHIETQPDIFRPWESYVPLRWDLSDLEPIVRRLLKDDQLRHDIALSAFNILNNYLTTDAFATQMAPLFHRS